MATRKAFRSAASGSVGDLETATKSTKGCIPKAKKPKTALAAPMKSKGDGNLKANNSAPAKRKSTAKRTPAQKRAEIERVAKERGADLSEEGCNQTLRK